MAEQDVLTSIGQSERKGAMPVVAVLSGGGPNFINNERQEAEVETAAWRAFCEGLNDADYAVSASGHSRWIDPAFRHVR